MSSNLFHQLIQVDELWIKIKHVTIYILASLVNLNGIVSGSCNVENVPSFTETYYTGCCRTYKNKSIYGKCFQQAAADNIDFNWSRNI